MTTATRIPAADITGLYGALVKIMTRKMLGQVPDSVGVMWHQPKAFKALMGFGRKVDLLAQLGPAAMVELAARVGAANLTARVNIALGIRSQEFSAACGLAPLARPSADIASAS